MTIAWHIDLSSIVCSLIYNCKLANQIATLPPIVIKIWINDNSSLNSVENLCSEHWNTVQWMLFADRDGDAHLKFL